VVWSGHPKKEQLAASVCLSARELVEAVAAALSGVLRPPQSVSRQPTRSMQTMESSSLKGLEFLVIVGAVAWFYMSQQRNLKRLKEEREAKQAEATGTPEDKSGAV
jgi:hypothetical protein